MRLQAIGIVDEPELVAELQTENNSPNSAFLGYKTAATGEQMALYERDQLPIGAAFDGPGADVPIRQHRLYSQWVACQSGWLSQFNFRATIIHQLHFLNLLKRVIMRKSKILAKVRAGQPARLAMMGYFIPAFVAYAAKLGFDGIWLDMEHHNFDDREVQSILAFFHLYDIDCLVRPPTREKARLYRYLEDGATGLIIPMSMMPLPPTTDCGL